jgi:hypothetical protein
MPIHVVKPSSQQWESLVNEVDHDGRNVGLAGEPRLYRVPIARFNIEQVPRQERSDMRVD